MAREPVLSPDAPPPSGGYSQGIVAGGFLFLSGQGPVRRRRASASGRRSPSRCARCCENLDAVARAAGGSLQNAVRVGMYISDMAHFDEMDAEYRRFFSDPMPARTTIQSDLVGFDVEGDAVVWLGELNVAARSTRRSRRSTSTRSSATSRGCRATATSTGSRSGRTSRRTSCRRSRTCSSRAGAVGITCQKLGEAEVMEARGHRATSCSRFPLVGAGEGGAARGARGRGDGRRSSATRPTVARGLSPALAAAGARGRLPRRGATPASTAPACRRREAAAELAAARRLAAGPALRRPDDLPDAAGDRAEAARARSTRSARAASRCASVSAGGTPTFFTNHEVPRDHRGARRHVRLRRPLVHRERHRCRSRTARCGSARRSSAGRRPSAASSTPGRRR